MKGRACPSSAQNLLCIPEARYLPNSSTLRSSSPGFLHIPPAADAFAPPGLCTGFALLLELSSHGLHPAHFLALQGSNAAFSLKPLSLKMPPSVSSLAVQWLRLCTSTAGAVGSITGSGTQILHAAPLGQNNNSLKD